ncbi:hypothetical protein M2161_003333 [Streptomyces sp. SAI-133]|nr:hypothetical protein [Streptomyces sp. SAI-133]
MAMEGRGDVRLADPVLPVGEIGDELVGEGLVLGGDLLVLPEGLLQPVPAGPLLAVLQAVLADVDLGVDVTEGLGDRLGALPADAGGGVGLLGGLQVTGLDGGGEGLRQRQGRVGLLLRVLAVRGDGRVQTRVALGGGPAGGLDLLADAVALHAGLAGDRVVAGLHLGGDLLLGAGADVLPLGDDPVVREQDVDLGDLGALVLDREFHVAGRELLLGDLALAVRGGHVDHTVAAPGACLLRAPRDGGQGRHGGGGEDGQSDGAHTSS